MVDRSSAGWTIGGRPAHAVREMLQLFSTGHRRRPWHRHRPRRDQQCALPGHSISVIPDSSPVLPLRTLDLPPRRTAAPNSLSRQGHRPSDPHRRSHARRRSCRADRRRGRAERPHPAVGHLLGRAHPLRHLSRRLAEHPPVRPPRRPRLGSPPKPKTRSPTALPLLAKGDPRPPARLLPLHTRRLRSHPREAEWLSERILSSDPPHDISLLTAYVRDSVEARRPRTPTPCGGDPPARCAPAMMTLVHHAERFSVRNPRRRSRLQPDALRRTSDIPGVQ